MWHYFQPCHSLVDFLLCYVKLSDIQMLNLILGHLFLARKEEFLQRIIRSTEYGCPKTQSVLRVLPQCPSFLATVQKHFGFVGFNPQCYRQWVYRAPLCITLKIKIWVVAYSKFITFFSKYQKKIVNLYLMQLFSADPTIVLRFLKMFVLTTKSWKNHPQKLLRIPQIHFFSLTALTAQRAETEEFMFQNAAYWPTVYI